MKSDASAATIRDTTPPDTTRPPAQRAGRATGRAYVVAVIVAGAVALLSAVGQLVATPPGGHWWMLLALTVLSGTAVLRIPSTSVNFSISDVFTLTSMVVFGPAAGVVAVAVDCLAISYRLARNRLPIERVFFNAAAPPLAMWLAAHLFFAASGIDEPSSGPASFEMVAPALVLAAGAYFLLNTFAVALAIALHEGGRVLVIWTAHLQNLWFSFLGGALGASFVVFGLQHGNYGTAVLALPLVLALILHFAYRNATGRVEDQVRHLAEVNRLHLSTVESLAHAIDAKDSVTHHHIRRVQTCALVLARRIGLHDERELKALEAAALLHDIGKLAVPEHILNKPGRLTDAEFERMKTHARVGAEILSEVDFPYPVVPIVRHHHENWDGSGYPDRLRGEEIPVGARILAVIDCFDALTSDRPYRRALSPAAAFEIIRERQGTMYDPVVVDAFGEIYPTLETESSQDFEHAASPIHPCDSAHERTSSGEEVSGSVDVAFALGAALTTCSTEEVPALVWDHLRHLPNVQGMTIYAMSDGSDALSIVFKAGSALPANQGLPIPLGERVSGWVAANGRPILNADAALEFAGAVPYLQTVTAVPLPGELVVGVIALYSTLREAFDQDILCILKAISPAIARHVASSPGRQAPAQTASVLSRRSSVNSRRHSGLESPIACVEFRPASPRSPDEWWTPRMARLKTHPVL